jgi:hypothetical protein
MAHVYAVSCRWPELKEWVIVEMKGYRAEAPADKGRHAYPPSLHPDDRVPLWLIWEKTPGVKPEGMYEYVVGPDLPIDVFPWPGAYGGCDERYVTEQCDRFAVVTWGEEVVGYFLRYR